MSAGRVSFSRLVAGIRACRACRGLFGFEPRPVVWGGPDARVFQVSQAPSLAVHNSGRPFADASGRTLRAWYRVDEETFYDPANFYITAAAHCFPGRTPAGADRRPPAACAERWLRREIEAVDHLVVVLVGRFAANAFFPGEPFERLVSADLSLAGRPCFALPHPSPLNAKWRKDHPAFERERLPALRAALAAAGVPIVEGSGG